MSDTTRTGVLVCLHAHPDDECMGTGGTIARAAEEGRRVVLVVATNGDFGEVPDDLVKGETLADRRRVELTRSAAMLGVHRVVWLGYRDSGMTGWPQNADPESFWQADVEQAAQRLADVLIEERADVLTTYDWHGNYGHPDHIQVHRVGHRAAEIAATPAVFEMTMNRDALTRMIQAARDSGVPAEELDEFDPNSPMDDGNPMGMTEAELTLAVDVRDYLRVKRDSLACHASQVSDTGYFAQMPDEAFAAMFGTEWFIQKGVEPGLRRGWLFDDLPTR